MTKTRILIIGLIILGILLVILTFLRSPQEKAPAVLPTPTPVAPAFPNRFPTGDTVTIDGVTVDNFYQTTAPLDAAGDMELANDSQYHITYLADTHQFLITITGKGFAQNRYAAEQKLLSQLGLSQEDACKLNIVITTTSSANPDQAGQSLPLSFCPQPTQVSQPVSVPIYRTTKNLAINVGNPPGSESEDFGDGGTEGSITGLVNAVTQILTCEAGGSHAPYPSCVNGLTIPQQFKNNLNATYPSFQCGQFIWSAQNLLGWPSFPGHVGSVFQWYTMNPGHAQNGYNFICNPYRIGGCTTSKTSPSGGAISPGDIILYGSTGGRDPGHIAIVVSVQSNFFTIRVAEANYRHGITWFRWTNLMDNLGRGANILGWWRKK